MYLEIISRLIEEKESWRDNPASIIEKLRFGRNNLGLSKLLYIMNTFRFCDFCHTVEFAKMFIYYRSDDIDEFFLVPYEFWINEDIIHTDIVGELDMFFSFIISKDISSFCLKRSFANMLLIEKIIIIIMPYYL